MTSSNYQTVLVEPGLEHVQEQNYKLQVDNVNQLDKLKHKKKTETTLPANTKKERTHKYVIKKSPSKKPSEELSTYIRKQCLLTFMDNDCTSRCLDKTATKYKANKEIIKEYFGKAAQDAQTFVHQECDSLCFSNITDWLKHFHELDVQKSNNFESAIIMNAIVNNEEHPSPESTGGVNLKSIYKFISNSLMGLPQKQLDPISGRFLSCEFQNLINEANTDEADSDVRIMKTRLETALDQPSSSLDPLQLTNPGELLRIIQTTTIKSKDIETVKIEK